MQRVPQGPREPPINAGPGQAGGIGPREKAPRGRSLSKGGLASVMSRGLAGDTAGPVFFSTETPRGNHRPPGPPYRALETGLRPESAAIRDNSSLRPPVKSRLPRKSRRERKTPDGHQMQARHARRPMRGLCETHGPSGSEPQARQSEEKQKIFGEEIQEEKLMGRTNRTNRFRASQPFVRVNVTSRNGPTPYGNARIMNGPRIP